MNFKSDLNHVELIKNKRDEKTISHIVDLILDLESMYLANFENGLLELDWLSIKRCKTELSVNLNKLGLYNTYLDEGFLNFFEDENIFKTIKDIPRIKLCFNPRGREFPHEDLDDIKKSNDKAHETIALISQNLASRGLANIQDVRKKYVTETDGFLFSIKFQESIKIDDFFNIITSFKEEVENLTLEELMIAQQFTDLYKASYANPFTLGNEEPVKSQMILISLRNIETSAPFYFFNTIILNIIASIQKKADLAKLEKKDSLKAVLSYNSINQSHISYNLDLEL